MTEPVLDPQKLTRRRVIAGVAILGAGGVATGHLATKSATDPLTPTTATSPPSQPPRSRPDFATRQAYDEAEATYRRAQPGDVDAAVNLGGSLAWGESRALQSYLTMYEATNDVSYINKLIEASQPVLSARDDRRGQVDYRGLSLPAWGAANPYTVSQLDLSDELGTPTVRLVSAATEQRVMVDVRSRPDGLFNLTVRGSSGLVENLNALSLNPLHPRYFVRTLRDDYPGPAACTATDLRPNPVRGAVLADVTNVRVAPERYVFAVHTGMICAPWTRLAALLVRDPGLRRRFGGTADELMGAAEGALHVHESDWRQLSDKAGIYSFAVGSPVRADGTYLPHNQYLAVTRCFMYLYLATQNPLYRKRAALMLNLFRSDLSAGTAPTWPYHWSGSQPYRGFDERQTESVHSPRMAPQHHLEDAGHGSLDVEVLVAGWDAGFDIPSGLMVRLAATFLERVVRRQPDGSWRTAKRFNSSDNLAANDLAAVRWVDLSRWDRRVYSTVATLLNQMKPVPREGQVLLATAQMFSLR